jgi:hypothetical protein
MTPYEHEDRCIAGGRWFAATLRYLIMAGGARGDGTAGGVRTTPEQIGTATNWTSLPRIGSSDDSLALASA